MDTLVGTVRHYDWGSADAIPTILGVEPTGEPWAEYWLGAHPSSPSMIGDAPLDTIIAADSSALGPHMSERFDGRLSFLVKILSAARPLSLQAHPTEAEARTGYARETAEGIRLDDPTRTFKDTFPKPELIIAHSDFDALVGFRDPKESLALFDQLGTKASLEPIIGPLRYREGAAALAEVFLDALCLDSERMGLLTEIVAAAVKHVDENGPLGDFSRTAILLDEHFPGDPSLIAALLLNRRHLKPGQALHVRPGVMHAYLSGTGVEVMANSDNVLRGGLTHKHIDVNALVQVVDFTPNPMTPIDPTPRSKGVAEYRTDEEAFRVWRITPEGHDCALPGAESARILLAMQGPLTLSGPGGELTLATGRAAFLQAHESVTVSGDGYAYLTGVGAN